MIVLLLAAFSFIHVSELKAVDITESILEDHKKKIPIVELPKAVSACKKAMITGIAGQDAAYLAQYLLNLGYTVIGTHRRTSTDKSQYFWRLEKLGITGNPNLILKTCDITDSFACLNIVKENPDLCEIYNLAAQSFVHESFYSPYSTLQINGVGVLNLLEAIRAINKNIRFYQASTSELFGKVREVPQTELTPFYPRSPYAESKLYAHWLTINYRESYNLFACCGILFNHESPLRGEDFVTRKIANAVNQIKNGDLDCVELGNLNAKRDWGFAGDYVKAMHLMLQQQSAQEYVIATGKTYSVRYIVEKAFDHVGIAIRWEGEGEREIGINTANSQIVVKVNPNLFRPAEVDLLVGNPFKAKSELGWESEVSAEQLINMMIDSRIAEKENTTHK
jgi:GDPmannose 4,6-dehydratase